MGLMDRDYMRRRDEEPPKVVAKVGPVRFVRGPVKRSEGPPAGLLLWAALFVAAFAFLVFRLF